MDAKNMLQLLARDRERISDEDSIPGRRSALQAIHDNLFVAYRMEEWDYSEVFRELCKSIFKRYTDPVEKCRELGE